MTRQITTRLATTRRNLEVLEWIAGGALRPDIAAKPAKDTTERDFRRLHADPRFRARLWL